MNLRRVLGSLNAAVLVIVLAALFIFVNFIASRRYVTRDVTRTKLTALSDKTAQTLAQLEQPVRVVVFYQPDHRLYEMLHDVLAEYRQRSPTVSVEYVDPEQDLARAKQLVEEFQLNLERDQANIVIVAAGKKRKFLSDSDLAEYDYGAMGAGGQPSIKAFTGENALTSAIVNVTQAAQPLVWMTTGHGEKSPDESGPGGLSELKTHLERENMKIEAGVLLAQQEIPKSVGAVVIVGAARRLTEQELLILHAYLEGGGRLFALVDPLQDSGLDGLLLRWGLELGHNIVVDPARRLPFLSPGNLFVTTYTQHPIVERMQTLMTLFPLARSVQPAQPPPAGLHVTPLALTSEEGWGESNTADRKFTFDEGQDDRGPLAVAAASERLPSESRPSEPEASGDRLPRGSRPITRIVAVGDSDFLTNAQIGNAGNLDLALAAFHWLVGHEQLIGIGAKPLEAIKLNLTAPEMTGLLWLSLAGLPSIFLLVGAAVWWVRRR